MCISRLNLAICIYKPMKSKVHKADLELKFLLENTSTYIHLAKNTVAVAPIDIYTSTNEI